MNSASSPGLHFSSLPTMAMNDFPLRWRWTTPEVCVLPEADLAQIRPLSAEAARQVWQRSATFVSESWQFRPKDEKFPTILGCDSHAGRDKVDPWLHHLVATDVEVVMSWQPELAALCRWNFFRKYWPEFCYPASDDVSIWPENEAWVLHYWHEERFWFGSRQAETEEWQLFRSLPLR